MSKAILVIDMPKNCEECILCRTENIYRCQLNYKRVDLFEKPEWCPLKESPELVPIERSNILKGTTHEQIGWNRCLCKILGEE